MPDLRGRLRLFRANLRRREEDQLEGQGSSHMVYSQVPLKGEIDPLFLFDIRRGIEKPKIIANKPPERHTHGRIL